MPRLWVIRHAKSSWRDASAGDHDRDLNRRGRRDGPTMAGWLAAQELPPEHILASDALRTRRTAGYLADACGLAPGALEFSADLYLAATSQLLASVRALPDSCLSAAVVAHNPGVTEFANFLLERPLIDNFPTFGIAAIDIPGRWANIARSSGALRIFRAPKTLDTTPGI